jgi:hypothetical protein
MMPPASKRRQIEIAVHAPRRLCTILRLTHLDRQGFPESVQVAQGVGSDAPRRKIGLGLTSTLGVLQYTMLLSLSLSLLLLLSFCNDHSPPPAAWYRVKRFGKPPPARVSR